MKPRYSTARRTQQFTLNRNCPLAAGLSYANLCQFPGANYYHDSVGTAHAVINTNTWTDRSTTYTYGDDGFWYNWNYEPFDLSALAKPGWQLVVPTDPIPWDDMNPVYSWAGYPDPWVWSDKLGRWVMNFPGTMAVPTTPTIRMGIGTGDFSASTWVITAGLSSYHIAWFYGTNSDTRIGMVLNGSFANFNTGNYEIASFGPLTVNTWYHLTAVRKGGILTLFCNGVAGTPVSSTLSVADFPMLITQQATNSSLYSWNGQLGDICLWNRALSVEEIKQLADPTNVLMSGLIRPPRRMLLDNIVPPPIYTGSSTVSCGKATVVSSGTFTAPIYTGTGSSVTKKATVLGDGSFAAPVYSGTGSITTKQATVLGAGSFTAPVYAGTSSPATKKATVLSSGTYAVPIYAGTSSSVTKKATVLSSGTFTAPIYTGTSSILTKKPAVLGSGTFTSPIYSGDGSTVTSHTICEASGEYSPGALPLGPPAPPTIIPARTKRFKAGIRRPTQFTLNRNSPLWNGLQYAGLCQSPGSSCYKDAVNGNDGTVTTCLPYQIHAVYNSGVWLDDDFSGPVASQLLPGWVTDPVLPASATENDFLSVTAYYTGTSDRPNNKWLFDPTLRRYVLDLDGTPILSGARYYAGDFAASAVTGYNIGTGDFSFGLWMQPTIQNSGTLTYVATVSTVVGARIVIRIGPAGNLECNLTTTLPWGTPSYNAWQHVIVTRSSTTCRIYKNGVVGPNTISSLLNAANNVIRVGDMAGLGQQQTFTGQIGDVCVWNRCLSTEEIKQLADPANTLMSGLILPARSAFVSTAVHQAAPPEYDGTGSVSTSKTTVAGTGSYAAPIFAGTGSPAVKKATVLGSGTFTAPVYSGSASTSVRKATANGSGAYTAPSYAGNGSPAVHKVVTLGSGSFLFPVYSGSGHPAAKKATGLGAGSFTTPISTGTGHLATKQVHAAGAGVYGTASYQGSGASAVAKVVATSVGAYVIVTYTGEGIVLTDNPICQGQGGFTHPAGTFYYIST